MKHNIRLGLSKDLFRLIGNDNTYFLAQARHFTQVASHIADTTDSTDKF